MKIMLKINTSQAIDTLYVHKKFGDDIYVTFSLNDRTRGAADPSWEQVGTAHKWYPSVKIDQENPC